MVISGTDSSEFLSNDFVSMICLASQTMDYTIGQGEKSRGLKILRNAFIRALRYQGSMGREARLGLQVARLGLPLTCSVTWHTLTQACLSFGK